MQRIVVTGANKGIGLAIAEGILARGPDTFVYLGSRDRARGEAAAAKLVQARPTWQDRIEVVALDVASDGSVADAAAQIARSAGGERLYGLVNNAGINGEGAPGALREVVETNVLGIRRVTDALVPQLDPAAGRLVNVTSASGPMFVASCSAERQRFFLDPSATWPAVRALVDECLAMTGDAKAFAAAGLGDGAAYGLSKALANTLTMILARENPGLRVNACTPGFIETDMTRHFLGSGQSAKDAGMKTPADGARPVLKLLFDELEGNGWFFGSDGARSPLDRYRAPGTPPFTG